MSMEAERLKQIEAVLARGGELHRNAQLELLGEVSKHRDDTEEDNVDSDTQGVGYAQTLTAEEVSDLLAENKRLRDGIKAHMLDEDRWQGLSTDHADDRLWSLIGLTR